MEEMKKPMAGLTLGHAPHPVGLTMEENHWDFHCNPQNLLCDWFFKEKSNCLHLQSPGELLVAQHTTGIVRSPLPRAAHECHTCDTVTGTWGCFWHISHTSPELQKWAIRTVFHLEIWIFSTTNIFFPGRQHCQNVLFMQSSKREKKCQPN